MAAATTCYKRILQLLERWPIDESKCGRDLGQHLRLQINKAYIDNKFEEHLKHWDKQYFAIQRLINNEHFKKHPRVFSSSASGLTGEECHIALSNDFMKELEETEEPYYKKLLSIFKREK